MYKLSLSEEAIILLIQIPILFFSIVTHEIAHAYMAYRLGDPTAKNMGRLTYNPIKHLDFMGSMVFLITFTINILFENALGFVIGWPKPVMIDFRYFRNPQKGMALVALSGPLSNFAIAAAFLLVYFILEWIPVMVPVIIWLPVLFGVFFNLLLAIFNLIPIPPLDGSNIVAGFLPWRFAKYFYIYRYAGMIILFLILITYGVKILPDLANGFFRQFGIEFTGK